jgi:hypothetical protein
MNNRTAFFYFKFKTKKLKLIYKLRVESGELRVEN